MTLEVHCGKQSFCSLFTAFCSKKNANVRQGMIFVVNHKDFSDVSPRCGSKFIFQTSNEGGGFALTNFVLGKMPPKTRAPKPKDTREYPKDLPAELRDLLDIEWGFDSEGNLRTHGPLQSKNMYANFGSLKGWRRDGHTLDTTPGVGIVYHVTSTLGTQLNLGSKFFKVFLWAEKCYDGDNLARDSLDLFKEFNQDSIHTVVASLDGSTQRGVKGFGEEKGYT